MMHLEKINNIIHISDIHIRNVIRKDEYLSVFDRLYESLSIYDKNESIIVITGDIVHSKIDVSNELFSMVSSFLKNISDILPTVIMVGNHDLNLNNIDRTDSLTPIVNAINSNNMLLIKESGIYTVGDVSFGVASVIDGIDGLPNPEKIKSKNKIALFHGAVQGGVYDNDTPCDDGVEIKKFVGYDYVLLGDFHKRQFIAKNTWYVGSLIQQNFSEEIDNHGYIHIDLKDNTVNEYNIHNDYGFYNVDVVDGDYNLNITKKNPSIKINFDKNDKDYIYKITNQIKKKYNLSNNQIKTNKLKSSITDVQNNIELKDILKKDSQVELLKTYLKDRLNLSNKMINSIIELHNKYYTENVEINSNSHNWKIKKLEFKGLFSYEDLTTIDFENFNGTVGIFGKNASGKSSVLDILMFCIYDKSLKTNNANDMLNSNSKELYCKLVVDINGTNYYIERKGKLNSSNKIPISVDFYTDERNLNGDKRSSTNKKIRNYFGEFDDFIMSVVIGQIKQYNFIDLTQSERKDLIIKFLNLGIYDKIKNEVKEKVDTLKVKSEILKKDYNEEIKSIEEKRKDANIELKAFKNELLINESEHSQIVNEIDSIKSKIKKIDDFVDIEYEENKIIDVNSKIDSNNKSIGEMRLELDRMMNIIDEDKKKLKLIDLDLCNKDIERMESTSNLKKKYISELSKIDTEILYLDKQISLLDGHEYDENCKYCVNNKLVKNAIQSKQDKLDLIDKSNKLKIEFDNIEDVVLDYNPHNKIREHSDIENNIFKLQSNIELYYKNIETMSNLIQSLNNELENCNKRIELGNIQKNQVIENDKNEKILSDKRVLETQLRLKLNNNKEKISNLEYQLKSFNNNIIDLSDQKEKYEQILNEFEIYTNYYKSLSRDGLQLFIIEKVLYHITSQINDILDGVVDFKVNLTFDDKNINYYIVYNENDYWSVSNTSGMERFIINIATRVAMSQLSSVSIPDFIFIDEGFGTLDQDNLSNLEQLFGKLNENYRFILIISHLLYLKDLANKSIQVDKNNNGSYLIF